MRAAILPGDIVPWLVDVAFGHYGRVYRELELQTTGRVGDVDDPAFQPDQRIDEIDVPPIIGAPISFGSSPVAAVSGLNPLLDISERCPLQTSAFLRLDKYPGTFKITLLKYN